jgi:hypothetical protein
MIGGTSAGGTGSARAQRGPGSALATRAEAIAALVTRLEQATRPDGEIDIAIWRLLHEGKSAPGTIHEYKLDWDGCGMWRCKHPPQDFGSWWHLEPFTDSLDAALTLVPAGWWLRLIGPAYGDKRPWHARLVGNGCTSVVYGSGTSLSLALCEAALRAIAASETPAATTEEGPR